MLDRRRRLAASLLAIGLLAVTLFTADALIAPRLAEARCAGNGNPVRSTFSYNGTVRVSETPLDGTCNGNNIYRGTLVDERADGNCAEVWFKETGTGGAWISPPGGTACGGSSTFEWDDRNGNSRVYEMFCIYNPNDSFSACGWGTQVGLMGQYFGENYGY